MAVQNLAVKLCGILQAESDEEITAREWRLVGQEQDGSQLLTWVTTEGENGESLNIGVYTNKAKSLIKLHTFEEKLNIIQASVNFSHTLLVYVVKLIPNENTDFEEPLYCPFLLPLIPEKSAQPIKVEESSTKQIMLQYIYGKSHKYSPGVRNDRFLLFKHLECIKIYKTTMICNDCDDGTEEWDFNGMLPEPDTIVRVFSWAQWDCMNQVLYYIHYRQPTQSFAEGEEMKSPSEVTPTLSALQFNAELPHETVLNIPLSLPQLPSASGAACGAYEDDPLPLRVHDCSLDLLIVCHADGRLCVCHHYLYKSLDDSTSSLVLEDSTELKESGVNFAYSVTLLHHGCVVHSVVPDLPWPLAKSLRPSYTLYDEHHLLVNIPKLFTHLLDVTLSHEPCCHIVLTSDQCEIGASLAPIVGWTQHTMVDLNTLDIVTMHVSEKDIVSTFKSDTAIENKLSMVHYLLQHDGNFELAEDLIAWSSLNQRGGYGCLTRLLQEYLIGATFALTKRSLPSTAMTLMNLLPFTMNYKFADVKVRDYCVSVSQEKLWNSAVVVLAPRQRVSQFSEDLWTRLWATLNQKEGSRFDPRLVLDKLKVSLHSYQPEAVSRCSTPQTPLGPPPPAAPRRASVDALPFLELDICTASKQEHVIAANLREVSVHLMRSGVRGASAVESGVHGVATRWAAAQLDASRQLCRALTRALAASPANHHQRGLHYIEEMSHEHAVILFKVLEQYYLAADSIAFPLPQGFTSFFTMLAYKALSFHMFMQYLHRNVLELQIDVVKAIVSVKDDDKKRLVSRKLCLLQLCGEARARRALSAWRSRTALALRAADHAHALLSGGGNTRHRDRAATSNVTYLPSGERISPLDTFLALLTAKASLNELDFNLIIEATLATIPPKKVA